MYCTYVDQIPVYYQRLGKGEPLVLIHGLGEIKEGWSYQHELANEFELIIPDLRGHGESNISEGISMENFARDILGLLDNLEIENAHICGLSMGGMVAQEIFRQSPSRCLSLILVSTFHFAPKEAGDWYIQLRKIRSAIYTPDMLREISARYCLYSWDEELKTKFLNAYQPKPLHYKKSVKACLQVDNRDLLPQINVPTLIIGCQYDTVVPVWVQIMMHKQIPKSNLVILRDVGHIAKLEDTKTFNRTLRNFLGNCKKKKVV